VKNLRIVGSDNGVWVTVEDGLYDKFAIDEKHILKDLKLHLKDPLYLTSLISILEKIDEIQT